MTGLEARLGLVGERRRITPRSETPPIHLVTFRDYPDGGDLLAVTEGLASEGGELLLCVRATDAAWTAAAGEAARQLRARGRVAEGELVEFTAPIAEGSPLCAFLLFTPSLKLPGTYLQLYPIHRAELAMVRRYGFKWMFRGEAWDCYDVRRADRSGTLGTS